MTAAATDQDHVDAALAAINAALAAIGDQYKAYEVDELERMAEAGEKPDDYVEVGLTRRFGGTSRGNARAGAGGWRLAIRFVSRNYVGNARNMRTVVRSGVEYARLDVAGVKTTPVMFEGEDDIGEDDDWYSGLTTFTYARSATPPN